MVDALAQTLDSLSYFIERKEAIEAEIRNLRVTVKTYLLSQPKDDILRGSGLSAHLAKNGSSRRLSYDRLQKDHAEKYAWLLNEGILKITPPKEKFKLVVKKEASK